MVGIVYNSSYLWPNFIYDTGVWLYCIILIYINYHTDFTQDIYGYHLRSKIKFSGTFKNWILFLSVNRFILNAELILNLSIFVIQLRKKMPNFKMMEGTILLCFSLQRVFGKPINIIAEIRHRGLSELGPCAKG